LCYPFIRKGGPQIKNRFEFRAAGFLIAVLGLVSPVWAETVELVTYFPAGGGGGTDPQVQSLRVGNAYAVIPAPTDGVALVFDSLGIGIPVPGGGAPIVPAGALEVRGTAGQPDQVLFLPGVGGTLNVGIGTNAPGAELHVVNPTSAGNPNADLFVERTGANPSVGMVSAQGDMVAVGTLSEDPLALTTNNTTRIFISEAAGNNATDGFVGIGNANPQTLLHVGPAALLVQTDQGGSLELGGSSVTANPANGGMPYVDFHFGRLVGGVPTPQDFNARLINAADGRLDVQSSIGGAAAQTQLSVGANVGVGTTAPQTTSPQNNVNTGNLDANDVFIRSTGQWASQRGGGPIFIAPVTVYNSRAAADWTTFDASASIPAGATAVILEAEGVVSFPGVVLDTYVRIRMNNASPNYILLRAYLNDHRLGWGGQGVFPITAARTFQFQVWPQGFDGPAAFAAVLGCKIRIVGYYD